MRRCRALRHDSTALDLFQGGPVEEVLQTRVEVTERAVRAGDHDEPAAWPQERSEGAEHRVGGDVGDVDERVGLVHLGRVRLDRAHGARDHDVQIAVPGAQFLRAVEDDGGVGDVEDPSLDAAAAADPPAIDSVASKTRWASRPAARTTSPLPMRAAIPWASARPRGWSAPVTRAMRGSVMHFTLRTRRT
ncbi:hypothetical protein [Streptomyces sp. OE57]|uniref:hypothetical protein n=1 Tax=Streptomyces lacaronensis TaxID=3379885 RepID=UPI0039B77993